MCRSVFVSLALLLAPFPAVALPPLFTVDGPVPFDLGGFVGTIHPVTPEEAAGFDFTGSGELFEAEDGDQDRIGNPVWNLASPGGTTSKGVPVDEVARYLVLRFPNRDGNVRSQDANLHPENSVAGRNPIRTAAIARREN